MINIRFSYLFAIFILSCFSSLALNVEFNGSTKKVIKVSAEKNTGLDAIFVAYKVSEIKEIYISGFNGTEIEVERYGNLGGGFAESVSFSYNEDSIVVSQPQGNCGYIVNTQDGRFCFWLFDYSQFTFTINGVTLSGEQECETTLLNVDGEASPMYYTTIDGRQRALSREIAIEYTTQEWDEELEYFTDTNVEKIVDSFTGHVNLSPPFYCSTDVVISGDRFLKSWGIEKVIQSEVFHPTAVAVMSRANQTNNTDSEEGSNIITSDNSGLGGSAPSEILFEGFITEGVLHTEWQMASDAEFENIIYRFNEQDVTHIFDEEGVYYMRFIGSNSDGSCEAVGESYTISIGSSELKIPNAFSPNNDGVNDVWKVGYRSLLDFQCWIFDSKGNQIFHFDDPSMGWDGKYRGKTVRPGVYFYVIQATGADGKKYKKSGDINILNYKKYGESTGSVEE